MLSRLRPIFALFLRAVRDDLRARFPSVVRVAVLLILLALLWLNKERLDIYDSASGLVLLRYLATLNLAGISLLGLATFCSAITEEKEDGTLALLRMTRLDPLAILLGKSTARLAGGLLFLAVQFPFTLLCVALGGVTTMHVVNVYLILAGYLFFLCNLGLLFSVLFRGTPRAVIATCLVCFFLFLLAPYVWKERFRGSTHTAFGSIVGALMQFFDSINPASDYTRILRGSGHVFRSHSLAFSLVTGVLCFAVAWACFEHFCGGEMADSPRPAKTVRQRRGRAGRAHRPPLAWKDFHFATGGWRGLAIRLAIYAATFGSVAWWGWGYFTRADFWEDFAPALLICGGIGFILELALAAANIFGRERREHTLGTLCTVPISTIRLIWQKALGHVPALLLSGAIALAGWSLTTYRTGMLSYRGMDSYSLHAFLAAQLVFFPIFIAFCSLRLRRGALVIGLAAFLLWNFGALLFIRFQSLSWMRGSVREDYYTRMTETVWSVTSFMLLAALVLLLFIPRRLAACAGEE